ncbi:cytochrome c maturation protein CcmE [Flexilinea flocculi]|jgi:cytochrome c-type biogenesis protein CcmE|uniref:Cytochrome c-type biogenesis protein CcmE n=1 Tax=Flexilinea flocculi TaxID=1678840 RepID=A0A0S7BLC3_9CHLR|nr:cytochrome c maturation protein CcmE [Flexilinea flocculi]NMB94139.1 cytochrome c maturation protein CcmE [Flexilinea flocculi]GAP41130.1 cytochrome c-type biogenesis protein CcmE [Flexilinea flocculi]
MNEKVHHIKKTNWKVIIGCVVIGIALIYLLVSSTLGSLQYFITIEELLKNSSSYQEKNVRVAGVVIGDSITADAENSIVEFTAVNISSDHEAIEQQGGMEKAVQDAVNNPKSDRIHVIYHGIKPDMLKDKTQAIMTGRLISDQVFEAEELLLKCPSKYENAGK